MKNVNDNERSWAIQIISDINYLLKRNNLIIKLAGGENTISTVNLDGNSKKNKRMFPDMLLYTDETMSKIVQGWELKMPDTPITDIGFINDAKRKANTLKLNSFVIWNFNDCHFYIKDGTDDFEIAKTWSSKLSHIDDRNKVSIFQKDWKSVIREVVFFVNEFLINGKIRNRSLNSVITEDIVDAIIKENISLTADKLIYEENKNRAIGFELNAWWEEHSKEYVYDESDVYRAYSKVIILNWINKIIFANIIKYHHNPASKVELINENTTIDEAIEIFEAITKECDFYSIFSKIKFNEILDENTWYSIKEYNRFIVSKNLNQLEHSKLQDILENTVSMSKREISGQFTTPIKLAELLVNVTMMDIIGDAIDPCCGTGSIAVSILNMKYDKLGVDCAYKTTWGSDKYSFPLQIANIGFTKTDAIDIPSQLFNRNVFELKNNEVVHITDPKTGKQLDHTIPKYKTIISNLPFVPFEILSDDDLESIKLLVENIEEQTSIKLSKKSDLYAYIILQLWNLLDDNGRVGVIISNSWLGTDWGKQFRDIVMHYYNISEVIATSSGRWFKNAQVVTTILILDKKEFGRPNYEQSISFTTINKTLEEIETNEQYLEHIVENIFLKRIVDDDIVSRQEYSISQIKDFEKYSISWNAMLYKLDWLNEIIDDFNVLENVNKIFKVSRGERRGWDSMFYPDEGHEIEKCYLKNVLKTTRGIENLVTEADGQAFCCSNSLAQLKEKNHNGALAWINKFENAFNGTGKPLPEVLKRKNMHWYEMNDSSQAELITGMNPHKKLYVGRLKEKSFINQRLIGLVRKDENTNLDLSHALLNSILGMFFIEALGFGRGLGALDINSINFNELMMLNPSLLDEQKKNIILEKFKPILNREIFETDFELEQTDRIEFDKSVLEAYRIEKYYDRIKHSLLKMQEVRLSANI